MGHFLNFVKVFYALLLAQNFPTKLLGAQNNSLLESLISPYTKVIPNTNVMHHTRLNTEIALYILPCFFCPANTVSCRVSQIAIYPCCTMVSVQMFSCCSSISQLHLPHVGCFTSTTLNTYHRFFWSLLSSSQVKRVKNFHHRDSLKTDFFQGKVMGKILILLYFYFCPGGATNPTVNQCPSLTGEKQ